MSNYIIHSSGEWKNHKWVRREGDPGNYRYYYTPDRKGNGRGFDRDNEKSEHYHKQRAIVNEMRERQNSTPSTEAVGGERRETKEQKRYKKGEEIRKEMSRRSMLEKSGIVTTAPVGGFRNTKANREARKREKQRRFKGQLITNEMRKRAESTPSTRHFGGKRRPKKYTFEEFLEYAKSLKAR
jgi:hypothetical protein